MSPRKNKNNNDRFYLRAASAMIDYTSFGLNLLLVGAFLRGLLQQTSSFSGASFPCFLLLNCLATALYIAREEAHFWLLGDRASIYKIRGRGRKPAPYALKNLATVIILHAISIQPLERLGWLVIDKIEWSLEYWMNMYFDFYIILLLRDLFFMGPFHSLMHSNSPEHRWFRKIHERHHEAKKGAQSLHSFHINTFDLFIENAGAPTLMLLMQYLLGIPLRLSINSMALITCHDVGLHSVSPYSIMYFNPILDHFFSPNICHQLHHATNKDHVLFIPFHHAIPSLKREDERRYNETFKTDFVF